MRAIVLANALALAASAAWLAWLALPAAQAIRVRNAFLLRRGRDEDFAWTPANVPPDFRRDRGPVPRAIAQAVDAERICAIERDWPRAGAVVTMLMRHAREEAPIRADLATTFAGIVAGRGYCADHVRVFLAAAAVADLFCRQWAFSFDGFGGHGHTLVELWDRQRGRWALLDVHNNVYPALRGSETPLDAHGLRVALSAAPGSIEFHRLGEGRLGFPHPHKLADYYRRGAEQWYLWFGNDVVAREREGWVRVIAAVSGPLAHRVASACGRLPALVVAVTARNEAAVARMEALRLQVRLALVTALVLALLLFMQLALGDAG